MGNSLVKGLGITWVIIALSLMVLGLLFSHAEYEDRAAVEWRIDAGVKMYAVGIALLFFAAVIYLAGLLLRPSIWEILRAERIVAENGQRLQEYKDGLTPSTPGSHWDD